MFRTRKRLLLLLLAGIALASCYNTDRGEPTLNFTQQPVAKTVATQPLAARIVAKTNLNTGLEVNLDDGQGHVFTVFFFSQGTVHDDIILGLRPGRTYVATVNAFTLDDIVTPAAQPLTITTPPLPADFPDITLLISEPDRAEPGFTMFDVARRDDTAAYTVVVDSDGEVVWYLDQAGLSESQRLISTGQIMTLDESIGLIRFVNMDGSEGLSFNADQNFPPVGGSIPVDVAAFHADVQKHNVLNDFFVGNLDASQIVDDYPLDENDPMITGTVNVLDEPVVEFNIVGAIINSWSFLDILKPTRIGYDGTDGEPLAADWVHLTSIFYDVLTNSVIASLRNQDAVVRFDRATGDLIWILGNHDNWAGFEQYLLTPDGNPLEWQYHQSTAVLVPIDNTILVFDNGKYRASPFTGQPIVPADANQSRAVEYAVDEDTMTISQVWEWGLAQSGEALYSTIAGDANRLTETSNTLIAFGGLCEVGGVPSDDLTSCRSSARIIEVEDQTDERVLDLRIEDPDPMTLGIVVNRSQKLDRLYTDLTILVEYE